MQSNASLNTISGPTFFAASPYQRSVEYMTDLVQWPDLQVCLFRTEPLNEWLEIPVFSEDAVIIPLCRKATVEGVISKKYGPVPCNRESITIVPRGCATRWRFSSSEEFRTCVLYPSLSSLASVSQCAFGKSPSQLELREQVATADPLVWHLAVAIVGAMRTNDSASRLYVESLTHALTTHLLRVYSVVPKEPVEHHGKLSERSVQMVQEYVDANLDSELTLAEIAAAAHVSPFYLSRLFHQSTGFTVHQYVLDQRLARGNRLLAGSDLTVAEIAHRVGFADQSHFTRHFKLKYGCTPGQVRKKSTIVQIPGKNLQDRSAVIM